jgi:hypothetical protein
VFSFKGVLLQMAFVRDGTDLYDFQGCSNLSASWLAIMVEPYLYNLSPLYGMHMDELSAAWLAEIVVIAITLADNGHWV